MLSNSKAVGANWLYWYAPIAPIQFDAVNRALEGYNHNPSQQHYQCGGYILIELLETGNTIDPISVLEVGLEMSLFLKWNSQWLGRKKADVVNIR